MTGRKRIPSLGFLDRVNNNRGRLPLVGRKVRGSYGWREIDIFWPPQLRRSLSPSSVESFFPSLSIIGSAYDRDLCSEGILGLGYADVVAMLFSLIPCLLGLYFCLLRLNFCLYGRIFEPLGFFQLLFKGCHLFPGSSQLIIGLMQALPLILGLSLCTLQSRVSTLTGMFLISQLFPQFYIALISNVERLHNCYPPFFSHLPFAGSRSWLSPQA